jgi:hypothetical protein
VSGYLGALAPLAASTGIPAAVLARVRVPAGLHRDAAVRRVRFLVGPLRFSLAMARRLVVERELLLQRALDLRPIHRGRLLSTPARAIAPRRVPIHRFPAPSAVGGCSPGRGRDKHRPKPRKDRR